MTSLMPKTRRPCVVYLKILGCLLFLLVYFAIFLQESMNARKLKEQVRLSIATELGGSIDNIICSSVAAKAKCSGDETKGRPVQQ